jgi:hypothetical protein
MDTNTLNDTIQQGIVPLLKQDGLEYLIHYGSSSNDPNNAHDIDLFAVCNNTTGVESIKLGKIDLAKIGIEDFNRCMEVLDPAYATEPVLTGKLLYGNSRGFTRIAAQLPTTNPDSSVQFHLSRRFCEEISKAVEFFRSGQTLDALTSLSFSVGYFLFAQWYTRPASNPTTLQSLMNQCSSDVPRLIFKQLKAAKRAGCVKPQDVRTLLESWVTTVTAGTTMFHETSKLTQKEAVPSIA